MLLSMKMMISDNSLLSKIGNFLESPKRELNMQVTLPVWKEKMPLLEKTAKALPINLWNSNKGRTCYPKRTRYCSNKSLF